MGGFPAEPTPKWGERVLFSWVADKFKNHDARPFQVTLRCEMTFEIVNESRPSSQEQHQLPFAAWLLVGLVGLVTGYAEAVHSGGALLAAALP